MHIVSVSSELIAFQELVYLLDEPLKISIKYTYLPLIPGEIERHQ